MNRNALIAGTAAAAALVLAGCSGSSPSPEPSQTAVKTLPRVTTMDPGMVHVLSGRMVSVKYLGPVFRTAYTLRNNDRGTTDFLITFEYLDRTGVRIGQSVVSVAAMGPGRIARLSDDDLGSDGFSLKDISSVRVAEVRSWPTA